MRIRVYLDPSCGGIEDESLRPYCWDDHRWHMVCRDPELWEQYQNAMEELSSARAQLYESLVEEPLSDEELDLKRRYEAILNRPLDYPRDEREEAAIMKRCIELSTEEVK